MARRARKRGPRRVKSAARSAAGKRAARSNPWLLHVAAYRRAHPETKRMNPGAVAKAARKTYSRRR